MLTAHLSFFEKTTPINCPLSSHFNDCCAFCTSFDYFVMYSIRIQTDWVLMLNFRFQMKYIQHASTLYAQHCFGNSIISWSVRWSRAHWMTQIAIRSYSQSENGMKHSTKRCFNVKRSEIFIFRHLRWLHGTQWRLCIVIAVHCRFVYAPHGCDIRLIDFS